MKKIKVLSASALKPPKQKTPKGSKSSSLAEVIEKSMPNMYEFIDAFAGETATLDEINKHRPEKVLSFKCLHIFLLE